MSILSFTMVLGVGFLLLVSLLISAILAALGNFLAGDRAAESLILKAINFIISFGVTTVLFALIYKVLTDVQVQWRDVWIGAVATALLFTIGKAPLGWYLGRPGTTSTYGAAGSFVALPRPAGLRAVPASRRARPAADDWLGRCQRLPARDRRPGVHGQRFPHLGRHRAGGVPDLRAAALGPHGAGLRALTPGELRAWRALQGAAAGPLHPRAGALPLDPQWVLSCACCLARMPMVCPALAAHKQ
ncbi:MAG TPA: YihY/virulence factor BrkB family protein [Roseiflexaceae bacterium]|nr:YihY/virulence factor BrkB family protein [Roseiflexaceae bacterium]